MYKNHANVAKNRLYVTFRGKMDVEEVKAANANRLLEAQGLKPGFGVITDIAEFSPTTEEGRQAMLDGMKALQEMGEGYVVRIVTGSALMAANQLQQTSREVGLAAGVALSLAEAEALLDKLEKEQPGTALS